MTAQSGNINVYIDPDQIEEYVGLGYDIYDDEGNKLDNPMKYAVEKNIVRIPLFSGGNAQ